MLSLLGVGQGQNVDIIAQFKTRVALDSGTFEAESCLRTYLNTII